MSVTHRYFKLNRTADNLSMYKNEDLQMKYVCLAQGTRTAQLPTTPQQLESNSVPTRAARNHAFPITATDIGPVISAKAPSGAARAVAAGAPSSGCQLQKSGATAAPTDGITAGRLRDRTHSCSRKTGSMRRVAVAGAASTSKNTSM
ncbi:hypothetical protein EVAR_87931_1 [Eumeta japonica]|uniref:Uncharacterized protein n=1 Tax=Eumeta variegata TaxID=151549 RepID=A0A4C1WTM5_EUMVA|nr:hypothetical protein EVAR_87931_1 [Eumeta japonica]